MTESVLDIFDAGTAPAEQPVIAVPEGMDGIAGTADQTEYLT